MSRTIKFKDVYELYSAWESYHAEHPEDSWPEMSYQDADSNDVYVVSADIFWDNLILKYVTYRFPDPVAIAAVNHDIPYPGTSALHNFRLAWADFIDEHPEYIRLAIMMDRTDYDPLENYDRKEDGGWSDTTDDDTERTMSYAEQTTTTENDPRIKTKTTGSVYADDSASASKDTESIVEPVRDSETDVDTITTTNAAHDDVASVEGDVTVTREFQDYRVHGNVGVTTAAQMMEGELKVREKYNLTTRIIDRFVRETLTLQKEVWKYDD